MYVCVYVCVHVCVCVRVCVRVCVCVPMVVNLQCCEGVMTVFHLVSYPMLAMYASTAVRLSSSIPMVTT